GALGTLTIQWTGDEGSIDIDVDDYTGAGDAVPATASSPHVAAIETEGEDADE
ncbi:MAG: segregation/condensation protein A, partial [Thermobifida sp.]|nr:segregation/condensation protein A [Thermobifida sp.]